MEFVDKYLMPHKMAVVFTVITTFIVFASGLAMKHYEPQWIYIAVNFISGCSLLSYYAYIGWDSKNRLGYTWKDSFISAALIGIISDGILKLTIFFLFAASISDLLVMIVVTLVDAVFTGLLAIIGYAAAKYFGSNPIKAKKQTKH